MSFKDTKVYQEAFEEGRLEGLLQTVPHLLDLGLNIEQVAEALGLTIKQVQNAKLYHEALQEGERRIKLELMPRLLKLGMTVEQVSEALDLSIENIQQAAQQQPMS